MNKIVKKLQKFILLDVLFNILLFISFCLNRSPKKKRFLFFFFRSNIIIIIIQTIIIISQVWVRVIVKIFFDPNSASEKKKKRRIIGDSIRVETCALAKKKNKQLPFWNTIILTTPP